MNKITKGLSLLLTALLLIAVTAGSAAAIPGGWLKQRYDNRYHFVEQWSDYLQPGGVETTPGHPHAVNPTGCQWTYDESVENIWTNGVMAAGESVTLPVECFMSDSVERSNQALAFDGKGNPLQVTVSVANEYHSRSSTEMGETCVVGPDYLSVVWFDHDNPYAHFVVGSNDHSLFPIHDYGEVPDDGGWAVGPTTITVTVTNTGDRTMRDVQIWSTVGRPYNQVNRRPAACEGLTVTPYDGYEPQWRS